VAAEPDRVSIGLIVKFAALLTAVSLLAMVAVWSLFRLLEARTRATEAGPTPVEAERPRTAEQKLPPLPRLEIDPRASLALLRAEEDSQLSSYAWVDKPAGIVRIPIDRAMDLMVEREKKK
jgi:hypothetical protein